MSITNLPNYNLDDNDSKNQKNNMPDDFEGALSSIADFVNNVHKSIADMMSDLDNLDQNSNDDYDDEIWNDNIDFNKLQSIIDDHIDDFEDWVDQATELPIDFDKIIGDIKNSGCTKFSELPDKLDMSNYNETEKDLIHYLTDPECSGLDYLMNKYNYLDPTVDQANSIEDTINSSLMSSPLYSNNSNINGSQNTNTNSSFKALVMSCLLDHNIENMSDSEKENLMNDINMCNNMRYRNCDESLSECQINNLIDKYLEEHNPTYQKPTVPYKYYSLLCDTFSKKEFVNRFNIPDEIFEMPATKDNFDTFNLLDNFDIIPEHIRDQYSYCILSSSFSLDDFGNKCAVITLLGDKDKYIMPKGIAIYKDGNDFTYYSVGDDDAVSFETVLDFSTLIEAYANKNSINYDKLYGTVLLNMYNEQMEIDKFSHCFVERKRVNCPLSLIGSLNIVTKYEAEYTNYIYIGDVTVNDSEDAKDFISDFELKPIDGKLKFYVYSKDLKCNSSNIVKLRDNIMKLYDFNSDIIQNNVEVKVNQYENFIYINLD